MKSKIGLWQRAKIVYNSLPVIGSAGTRRFFAPGVELNLTNQHSDLTLECNGFCIASVMVYDEVHISNCKNADIIFSGDDKKILEVCQAYKYIAFLAPVMVKVHENTVVLAVKNRFGEVQFCKTPTQLNKLHSKPTMKEIKAFREGEVKKYYAKFDSPNNPNFSDSDGRPA